jgi:hypothetical protein
MKHTPVRYTPDTPAYQMHARGMHAREVRFDFANSFVVLDAEPGSARTSVLAAASAHLCGTRRG